MDTVAHTLTRARGGCRGDDGQRWGGCLGVVRFCKAAAANPATEIVVMVCIFGAVPSARAEPF